MIIAIEAKWEGHNYMCHWEFKKYYANLTSLYLQSSADSFIEIPIDFITDKIENNFYKLCEIEEKINEINKSA